MTGISIDTSPRRAPAAAQRRPCLGCQASFPSSGPHERICPRCKEGEDWQMGAVEHACHAEDAPPAAGAAG